jgi:hypothetical protein
MPGDFKGTVYQTNRMGHYRRPKNYNFQILFIGKKN